MDIEKLIERLTQYSQSLIAYKLGADFADACMDATTALLTLQSEKEKLRAELEQVKRCIEIVENQRDQMKRERDAAVKDLNEFLSMDELCPIQCEWCKWKDTFCDGKAPEWRGQKED